VRVLSICNVYPPHHLGGYEVICQGLVAHLRGEGQEARVLTTDYRRAEAVGEDEPGVYRQLGWYWRDHEWPRMTIAQRWALERRNAAVFQRHVGEFRPQAIAWWALGGMSLGLLEQARRQDIPGCVFVLDPWPDYGPRQDLWMHMWSRMRVARGLAARVTGLPTRVDLAAAGRWVFCSESMRSMTLETGLAIDDYTILRPGVDTAFLTAEPEPEAPVWRWRLLYTGRVVRQKGVHTAVEALARLPSRATLRIVGPGDAGYRSELEALAERLGVRDRLELEPARERHEMFSIYRDADVVLFPVEWAEPWGLVPLEAMALGRPVVATGRGGSGEYLGHERNALLFPAGDAAALASEVRRLADDAGLRERLVRDGRDTARAHSADQFNRAAAAELLALAR